MTDKVFVDGNVVIYGLNAALPQYRIATELLLQRPFISVQVVNETINVQMLNCSARLLPRKRWHFFDGELRGDLARTTGCASGH